MSKTTWIVLGTLTTLFGMVVFAVWFGYMVGRPMPAASQTVVTNRPVSATVYRMSDREANTLVANQWVDFVREITYVPDGASDSQLRAVLYEMCEAYDTGASVDEVEALVTGIAGDAVTGAAWAGSGAAACSQMR